MFNRCSKRERHKDEKNMDKKKMIETLLYRIQRYQAMGNGVKCQSLYSELNRIQGGQTTTFAR